MASDPGKVTTRSLIEALPEPAIIVTDGKVAWTNAAARTLLGAHIEGADLPRLADLALAGEVGELGEELARLYSGAEAIPIVRALQRRLLMLAPGRARIERGDHADAVMTSFGKALFWKDKPLVQKLLQRWDARGLATVSERAGQLERDLLFSPAPDREAVGEELLSIARAARSRR
jgi:DNA polymerase-3 subunit delta